MTTDLIEIWKEIEDPDFHVTENQLHPKPKPFTILTGSKLRTVPIPEKVNILGDGVIALGQLTTVIGQGGTGKSRVTMQVAITQILGWSFAGLKTHPTPLKHLLIGTENSIYRQKSEYQKMTQSLSPEQREKVDAHMFFHVVQEMDDAFINLGDEEIRSKWVDTLSIVNPDVVYIDPYGEIHVGDINKDADVRHTLREITKVCRRFNPRTAIVIVHHGRTGRANIAQAVGWDKGNYALGSKALYSGARAQINIAPADAEDPSRIIISCGKSNDAKPFDPVGLKLDDATMLYGLDAAFDLQAWKDDLDGKQRGQAVSVRDVTDAIRDGKIRHKDILEYLTDDVGCGRATAARRIAEALEKGYARKTSSGEYCLGKE
ncbi:AAA family ATPase [Pelagicoccus sp. SDUM812002]|uniref:AAA family ATPase n=1 Tax=Pelagicoccus sp. SDUM812002 TaxID=3041266 RepID=UPI0028107F06|nr:AAA family ATPase [Pelagicoccus sp. SDUM812002]MDQ8184278.1 AAA family ATPase [Pelagicoccus sp. SDUM812002]